jgi:hypothetical protein
VEDAPRVRARAATGTTEALTVLRPMSDML